MRSPRVNCSKTRGLAMNCGRMRSRKRGWRRRKTPCSAASCVCASRAAAIASGTTPFLLAAATAARAGDHAVDLGAGVGAAGLALAVRVPALTVTLAEIDPQLCALAEANARANGLDDRVEVLVVDIAASGAFDAAGLNPGTVDCVLMNPPFNDPARQNTSPDPNRRLAHAAAPETLALWINTAARLLVADGVITMIWRAEGLAEVKGRLRRASARSRCCRFTVSLVSRPSACSCGRPRQAMRRQPCCPGSSSMTPRGAPPRKPKRCCATVPRSLSAKSERRCCRRIAYKSGAALERIAGAA